MADARRRLAGGLTLLALLPALGLAACGGDEGEDGAPAPPREAAPQQFPQAEGRTLEQLAGSLPEGPVLAPTVSVVDPGRDQRVGFALFDRARRQISGAPAALYVARSPTARARGPFPARMESLSVKPQFLSRTSASDQDLAKAVYVSGVSFPRRGKHVVIALARLDGRVVRSSLGTIDVGKFTRRGPPDVGDRAISIHTPTRADVGGDMERIDTRIPPAPQLHDVDFADVLGKRPAVIVFATPQLCESRVCGPVVDVAAQVEAEYGDRVEFVHMEIYRNNRVQDGYRPQFLAWRLPSEPWTFVVDRSGRVAARFESAVSVGELERAVERVAQDA